MGYGIFKKYIEKVYNGKLLYIIELKVDGAVKEYVSAGCRFVENTKENREVLTRQQARGFR